MRQPTQRVIVGGALTELRKLPSRSVHCCVTSPPYWQMRDYGVEGQLGLEDTPEEFVAVMVRVFREARRVLRNDGTLWLNLGDTYVTGWPLSRAKGQKRLRLHGLKEQGMAGIPWRTALALQQDGWDLRCDVVWHKPNPVPESVKDRPTRAHEYVFLLAKSPHYFYDADAIREPAGPEGKRLRLMPWAGPRFRGHPSGGSNNFLPGQCVHSKGRNKRSVWTVSGHRRSGTHTATFPERLVEPCVLAGCPKRGTVLDPFAGVGTTLSVANRLGRNSLGIELNANYCPEIP